jgi:diguanylate cyclase (GGDEF)-like protein
MSDARLLLVDHDPQAIEALSSILSPYPEQRFASQGLDALRLALSWEPDLVLLDAQMQDMSSLDWCQTLKGDTALAEVPVIFVSSHSTPEFETMAFRLGAADFISKPLQPEIVRARVGTQLKVRELTESLRLLATLDGPTGIANRRVFDDTLRAEWQRSRRSGQPLSLLMADIDCFKAYNDRHGHQTGDQCLRQVARALQSVTKRPADLPARYGGDEFVMVLPDTDPQGAVVVAQALMAAMQQLALPHGASSAGRSVTLSVGLCTFDAHNSRALDAADSRFGSAGGPALRAGDLLRAAQSALYQAKHAGQAQVWSMVIDDAIEVEPPLLCHTPKSST